MKSLVSWHYCMIDIEKIRAMTIAKVCPQDHVVCPEGVPCCSWHCCFYQADLTGQLIFLHLIKWDHSAFHRGSDWSSIERRGWECNSVRTRA
jgi:hypothetical protein